MTTNPFRATLLALAAMAAIALAACGGGAATTSGPGGPAATTTSGGASTQLPAGGQATPALPVAGETVDACALLTDDDIKAVTGYAVAKKTPGPQGGVFPSGCQWDLTAKETVPPAVLLGIMTTGGKAYYDRNFKPFNEGAGYKLVPGVGDEVWDAGFGVIQGVKGDALFNLQYLGRDDHQLELTKKLLAHI